MEDPFKKPDDYEPPVIVTHQAKHKSLSTLRLSIYIMTFVILAFFALNPCNYMGDRYYRDQMVKTSDSVIQAQRKFYEKNQKYTDDLDTLSAIKPGIREFSWIDIQFTSVSAKGFTFTTKHQNKEMEIMTFDQNGHVK